MRRSSLAIVVLATASLHAEPLWPEFRGPTGQGHSLATGLPTEWSKTKNVRWRQEIEGRAWSSPVVANNTIYVTNAEPLVGKGEDRGVRLTVIAMDAATGKATWTTPIFEVKLGDGLKMHSKNSHASPTLIFEGGKLYAHFGHHGTACVSDSGKLLWQTQEHAYPPVHGTGGSPALWRDLLIFNADGASNPSVIALEKRTGRTAWKVARPENEAKRKFSFSTPLVIDVGGKDQLITCGSGMVQALNPKNGEPIWHVLYGGGYSVVPRPVFAHGMVFLSSGYDKPVGLAIRADGKGDVTTTHVAWTAEKRVPLNPSMLVVGDDLYMLDDKGMLSSRDARTGAVHYEERLIGPSSSSLLYADGHIYAIDEQGKAAVVQPGKTFQVLATSELNEKTLSSMSVCDSDLLIRTEAALYRIGKP
jgi:outer membrane protein assembly factor BamB